jgi:galactokinase
MMTPHERTARLRQRLQSRNTSAAAGARLFRAPGRVNLIGEHTDYNDGFVMPLAIGFDTWVMAAPRSDGLMAVESLDFDERHLFRLEDGPTRPPGSGHWSAYVEGVAHALNAVYGTVNGADLVIHSTVPMGSGLSSSAALEVAVALALTRLKAAEHPSGLEIARVCQRAENEFVGARCGIMDQYASVHGVAGHAVHLDCRSLTHQWVPLQTATTPFRVVVCNSMVRHQLAGGEYNKRRQECEAAVQVIASRVPGVHALRDVSEDLLRRYVDRMDPIVWRRARHVVTENDRVAALARALPAGEWDAVAAILQASHDSLRDDYEVSCAELDLLVEIARRHPGTRGSRMTGGGFGGCTVNVVAADAVESFCEHMTSAYTQTLGYAPEIYVCDAAEGAAELYDL